MLATLDPHSGYLDPDFYQDLQAQTKGEFGGLGLEITIQEGLLVVVTPMEGSPADKAGVKAGDAIVKIGNEFTKQFSLIDAIKKLRGPKGSPIEISVLRKGAPDLISISLVRDNIQVKSVKSRYLGDGYGYVRINQFAEKTTEDLQNALHRIASESADGTIHGLILDMRNNPGGLLQQAVRVSDLFLNEGIIVYTDSRLDSQKQKYFAQARGTEPDYPIVVIVNGGSASASEIVAGALKDHGRAIVVGTQTFGKGSVQTITPLDSGGALTLTTALYFTKSGRSLQALGVTPDVIVEAGAPAQSETEPADKESEQSTSSLMRESDLPGAIRNPNLPEDQVAPGTTPMQKINKTPVIRPDLSTINPEKTDLSEWISKDNQFAKAFEMLKSFNVLLAKADSRGP